MAIKITDECINCGACEPECPNNAIYEGGAEWRFADGTKVKGEFTGKNSGITADANAPQTPYSMDVYYIATDNVQSAQVFMMNLNVQRFALLTVV